MTLKLGDLGILAKFGIVDCPLVVTANPSMEIPIYEEGAQEVKVKVLTLGIVENNGFI